MGVQGRVWLVVGGAVAASLGLIVAVVFFLQPWRTCDYEDTAAGCAMLPTDATIMTIAALIAVMGAGALAVGIGLARR